MKSALIIGLFLSSLFFINCKDSEKGIQKGQKKNLVSTTLERPLLAQGDETPSFSPKVFYVTANSGLSLRAGSNLNSKKLLTLPYGAQVEFLSSPKHTEMSVSGVDGKMVEIAYQGARGYAFNGYLSSLAPPQSDETIENYVERIGSEQRPIVFTKKPNKKGKNYGMTTTIELPAKSWSEMYRVSQRLFHLPKSIQPDFGAQRDNVILVNKDKRERTFKDEMTLETKDNGELLSILYTYRLRDYSRIVTIVKTASGFKVTEVEESI